MTAPDINKRLDTLEKAVASLATSRMSGDRLATGVERLTDETAGLNAILNKVDEQQVRLTTLGTNLDTLQKTAAPRDEVKSIQQKERRDRRRLVALASSLVALIAFALVFGLSEAAHDACEKRQAASRAVSDTLETFKGSDPTTDKRLQDGIDRIQETLGETCDEQYVLHLP